MPESEKKPEISTKALLAMEKGSWSAEDLAAAEGRPDESRETEGHPGHFAGWTRKRRDH